MTPTSLIELLETAGSASAARARLRPFAKTPGLSQAYFDRIVSLIGSNPEAGRALASRWRIVAELGDRPALALRAKGASERLRGQWRQSVESFRRAADAAEDPVEKLAFQVGAVDSLARTGAIDEAVRLGRRLARGLVRLNEPGLAGRCRLNVAAAFLWADRYVEAAEWLRKAREELDAAGLENEAAGARMSLSTCALHAGRPEEAIALASDAATRYRNLGQEHMVRLCESNLAQAYLQIGRADEALEILLRLRDGYATSALDAARVEEFLGDAYFNLNMPQEARHAYDSAARLPAMRALPLNRANCQLGASWSARAIGQPKIARRAAVQAAATYERFGNQVWSAIAQIAEAQAWLDADRPQLAVALAEPAVASLKERQAAFSLAEAYLVLAEVRLQLGQSPSSALAEAGRLIRKRGMAGIEWRLHDLRARAASDGKRLPHYRKMANAISRQRARVVSTYAKTHYLADKSLALGRYLDELLSRPNPARLAEAIDVIRSTRAAALIDETISALSPELSEGIAAELAQLRQELARDENDEGPNSPPVRRRTGASVSRAAVARKWIELTHRVAEPTRPNVSAAIELPQILTITSNAAYLIEPRRAQVLIEPEELSRRLRWLRFELFEPQSQRNADPTEALRSLAELKVRLNPVFEADGRFPAIAPEGEFWGVPWAALANLNGPEQEPVLTIAPGFGKGAERFCLPPNPRVVIWGSPRADLPQIERELDAVRAAFPNAVQMSSADHVREFMNSGEADLLHIAAHARLDPFKPMFSFLEFDGGKVYAVEIARSSMRIELATLSACDTGGLSTLNRLEPDGLVRAFLSRGAKAALASIWALDDEVAFEFSETLYSLLRTGQFLGLAVSGTRDRIRKNFAHPYFWAPMTLFGGYRP